jgi:glycosyltransferase involved in cell wall biosynthesis
MAGEAGATRRPRVDMIAAIIPPYLSGISDFSGNVAAGLSRYADVRVLLGWHEWNPIEGVRVEQAFSRLEPFSVNRLPDAILRDPPEWVIVQYDPDTLVTRGMTPLPFVLRAIKRRLPNVRIATMVHEWTRVIAGDTLKLRLQLPLLRWQLQAIGRLSDVVFFSTEPWTTSFRAWFPKSRLVFMPVGSMIPRVPADREAEKARLGVPPGTLTLGLFSRMDKTADPGYVEKAVRAVREAGQSFGIIYTGVYRAEVEARFGSLATVYPQPFEPGAGAASMEEVSRRFTATDIYLLPDLEGVTARRTRLMTSLAHGVPTVSTESAETDAVIREANGKAFLLARHDDPDGFAALTVQLGRDADRRERIGREGLRFYEANYSWERIYELWAETLGLTAGA